MFRMFRANLALFGLVLIPLGVLTIPVWGGGLLIFVGVLLLFGSVVLAVATFLYRATGAVTHRVTETRRRPAAASGLRHGPAVALRPASTVAATEAGSSSGVPAGPTRPAPLPTPGGPARPAAPQPRTARRSRPGAGAALSRRGPGRGLVRGPRMRQPADGVKSGSASEGHR